MNENMQLIINHELNKRSGQDLINAVYEIRQMLELSEKEFFGYYRNWCDTEINNQKGMP